MSFQPSLKIHCSPRNPRRGCTETDSPTRYVDFAILSHKGSARSLQLLSWCQLVTAEKVRRWNTGASPWGKGDLAYKRVTTGNGWRCFLNCTPVAWIAEFVLCHRSPISRGITLCSISGKQSLQRYCCENGISTSLLKGTLAELQCFSRKPFLGKPTSYIWYGLMTDRRIQWCCILIVYISFKVWNCNSGKSPST